MSLTQSSPIETRIPPRDLTPEVDTAVFNLLSEAQFWLGEVAAGAHIIDRNLNTGAHILRANVYIDEFKFLPETARRADGTEYDDADDASTHFAVVENDLVDGRKRIVGASRLIRKFTADDKLPIEEMFPEAFPEPASIDSVEASRFIARHPHRQTQNALSLSLIRAMALHSSEHGMQPAYAIVEKHLARLFKGIGMPFEQIATEKMIPEYATKNLAIRINPAEVVETALNDINQELFISRFMGAAVLASSGKGYFAADMMNPLAPQAA